MSKPQRCEETCQKLVTYFFERPWWYVTVHDENNHLIGVETCKTGREALTHAQQLAKSFDADLAFGGAA